MHTYIDIHIDMCIGAALHCACCSRRTCMRMRVQPATFSAPPTPTPARRALPRSPTSRRAKPQRRPSRRRTVVGLCRKTSTRAAASCSLAAPRKLSTTTPTRTAPLPLTRSRCASAPVRRSNRRLLHSYGVALGGVPVECRGSADCRVSTPRVPSTL